MVSTPFSRLCRRARKLKRQVWALYLALKDGETPLLARIVAAAAVAYALSPIDLIPDFIPVLGYLDDLIILPALIVLTIRLIPPALAAKHRREAWWHLASGHPIPRAGTGATVLFVLVWLGILALILKSLPKG